MALPPARRDARVSARVAILAANPETLDGLHAYLVGAGVSSQCTSAVHDVDKVAPDRATAAVIFPDDFGHEDVLKLLRHIRRARPHLLAMLVTSEPQRFRSLVESEGLGRPPILLPKPCFGWDILDAIRGDGALGAH